MTPTVPTIGRLQLEPNVITVIPSKATFTVYLRDPDVEKIYSEERALEAFIRDLEKQFGVTIKIEQMARFKPAIFNELIIEGIERAAAGRGLSTIRMTSGAGHDAQMLAFICLTAMIFVPSVAGVSHNPKEHTSAKDLIAGANVLLDVVQELAS